MAKISWPKISELKDGRFRVDTGRKVSPRKRSIVETQAAAQTLADEWRKEHARGGKDHFLDQAQRLDAMNALGLLEKGAITATLTEAVRYFIASKFPSGGDITLRDLVDFYVAEKHAEKRRINGVEVPRFTSVYLRSLHRLERLADDLGSKRLSVLTGADVSAWLSSRPLNDYSRRQYHNYLKMLFGYAVKREFVARNPMTFLKAPHVTPKDPEILTVAQASSLLNSAWDEFDGLCFPYVLFGLFCGIRPHEMMRLKWGDIRNRNVIRLSADKTKTNDPRSVPIPFNATLMMTEYWARAFGTDAEPPDPALPIVPIGYDIFRRKFHQVYRRAGIKRWPKDAMRHTFASFYFKATDSDMGKLMSRLGHSTPKMSLKHYLNLTDESWVDYFMLTCSGLSRETMEQTRERCRDHTIEHPGDFYDTRKLAVELMLLSS